MSFNTGLSGLNAASKNLDVIGHNIANANTIGMKASRAEFSEAYASSLAASAGGGFGIGVQVSAVSQQFTQGNISVTGNDTDVAINGAGFFVVQMPDGSRAYTRAGNFKLNAEGNIVTNDGAKLLNVSTNSAITLPTGQGVSGIQTANVFAELNLDTRAPVWDDETPPVPLNTYGTTIQVYDSQGAAINVDLYFRKTDANTWNVYANYPIGGEYPADLEAVETDGFIGPLTFNTNGFIEQADPPTIPLAGVLELGGIQIPGLATDAFDLSIDLSKVTQNASAFTVTALEQDGSAPGQLTGIAIEAGGEISARYSNGQTILADQINLANFRNVSGLVPINGGYWVETVASGVPVVAAPGTGNLGSLRSGALEESNVELTQELVNMITAQRSYQANAQTIKTQDQVLQTLVNLR